MKKKNLIFAAAMSAVMAMSVTAPNAFAVKETKPAVTEAAEADKTEKAEKEKTLEFKKQSKFGSPKSGRVMAVDSDGVGYYWGSDRNGSEFFTMDKEGNVLNSYRVDNYNDGNLIIGVMNVNIKPLDDCVLLTYEKCATNTFLMGNKGCVVVKLDKELNEISQCDIGKCKAFDTNGEKIVTMKGKKIYLSDMNGKNKKLVYTINGDKGVDYVDYVAISDTHIGFGGAGGFSPDTRYYTGVIDIETGEVTVKQQERGIWGVSAAADGRLVWESDASYNVPVDDGNPNHHIYGLKNYDDREYYLFDGEKFDKFVTKDVNAYLIIDSDGNFITYDIYMKYGNVDLKVYKNGKVADKYTLAKTDDGFVKLAANGGTIAVCTQVQPEGADTGWYSVQPGDAIEYHEPFPINVTIISYSE